MSDEVLELVAEIMALYDITPDQITPNHILTVKQLLA